MNEIIGGKIKSERQRAGMTQDELAAAIGSARPTLARWESGAVPVTVENLVKIATALEVPPERFLLGQGSTLSLEDRVARIHGDLKWIVDLAENPVRVASHERKRVLEHRLKLASWGMSYDRCLDLFGETLLHELAQRPDGYVALKALIPAERLSIGDEELRMVLNKAVNSSPHPRLSPILASMFLEHETGAQEAKVARSDWDVFNVGDKVRHQDKVGTVVEAAQGGLRVDFEGGYGIFSMFDPNLERVKE